MKPFLAATLLLLSASASASAFGASSPDDLVRWIVVDGIRVRYFDSGSGVETPPVLLMVHGWAGSAPDFLPLFERLPGWRAIALDLPGSGASAKPAIVYDLPFFVGFLRSFCVALGLDRFVLLGHSMGGQFAVHYASLWPDSVRKLILVAPYGMNGEDGSWLALARWGGFVELGFRLNNRLFIEWTIRANVFYRPTPEMMSAAVEASSWMLGPEGARSLASMTRNVIGHGYLEELLPRITQETLVVWGDHDKVLAPRWAQKYVDMLPRARLEMIVDSGHVPMVEKPDQTAAAIAAFLETP